MHNTVRSLDARGEIALFQGHDATCRNRIMDFLYVASSCGMTFLLSMGEHPQLVRRRVFFHVLRANIYTLEFS